MLVREEPARIATAPRAECEIGTRKPCTPPVYVLGSDDEPTRGPYRPCVRGADGVGHYSHASCNTPLVVAFDAAPVAFTEVDADFRGGSADRTAWVSARTPWLALDRDGSGCIDSEHELFAGFEALARLDANGDGVLDARDPAFAELVLWSDANQDKRCTPDEVHPLGLRRLALDFVRGEPALGSYEGETASFDGVRLVDVHLAAE